MQDETFADIADTVQWKMTTNFRNEYLMITTNELIRSSYQPYAYAYCKSIKTGNTSRAGNCFVGYTEYGDAKLYSVVMGCDSCPWNTAICLQLLRIPKRCLSGALTRSPQNAR